MAAELRPPEQPIDTISTTPATATTAVAPPAEIEKAAPPPPPAPKRQRRPSVRLGEIGEQATTFSYDTHVRRTKHPWRIPKDSSKSVKARSLTNLVNGNDSYEIQETEGNAQNGEVNLDFGHRKKAKRATTKRDSDSLLKEQSPVHSVDNVVLDMWHGHRRTGTGRPRVSESRENDAMEMENHLESDSRDRNCGTSEGVRTWLIELGLSRYAPVFEVHEVDDEILPLLTLEDLKDMGINAVGSRRKLYSAIQKLRKGFS
ncbi:hypothetical protein GH714_026888 [Hevea brasiliensis]|uniref:SAM domain-containing protein n=1 Tax=Hevea brasiliensis TaxID=3981 RepID=A0A6A6M124_HEVBR|nr:hypothetical protein GH714_026888 [Hevea brasiliensis]